MKILVIEDERIVARRLIRLVTSALSDRIESIRHLEDFYDGLDFIRKHPIDLLFLDLNLNGSDGFALLLEAVSGSFQTIIVSAHSEQAIRAFEYGVTDFIAKPYTEERLKKALNRVIDGMPASRGQTRFLAVRQKGGILAVPISDILFIQGADDYSEIHCLDGTKHLHDKTLQELGRYLPECFKRIHRSYIVNFHFVKGYENLPGTRYRAILTNSELVPVSRSRIGIVRKMIQ
jgi:DNA-binding LytR/AlgR family response regulator